MSIIDELVQIQDPEKRFEEYNLLPVDQKDEVMKTLLDAHPKVHSELGAMEMVDAMRRRDQRYVVMTA